MPLHPPKLFLFIALLAASVVGFMIRLPRIFHHLDKELHSVFYFGSFLFLCWLYPHRWVLIFLALGFFGIAIEGAQDFSNKISLRLIGKRIHGRFDPEDIKYNLIGLLMGLIIFGLLRLFRTPQQTTSK